MSPFFFYMLRTASICAVILHNFEATSRGSLSCVYYKVSEQIHLHLLMVTLLVTCCYTQGSLHKPGECSSITLFFTITGLLTEYTTDYTFDYGYPYSAYGEIPKTGITLCRERILFDWIIPGFKCEGIKIYIFTGRFIGSCLSHKNSATYTCYTCTLYVL